MKKLFLFLIVAPITINAQIEMNSINDEAHTGLQMQMVSNDDGSYVEILSAFDPNGTLDFVFRKKSASGDLILQTRYDSDSYYSTIAGVSKTTDNGFVLCLEYANIFDFVKINSNNEFVWSKKVSIPEMYSKYYNHKIVKSANGGFYLMISDVQFLGVVKFDNDGNKLWARKAFADAFKSPGFDLVEDPEGNVHGTLKDNSRQCIVTISSTGALLSSSSMDALEYRWPKIIRFDAQGNKFVAGDINSAVPYFQKYDASGTLVYAKRIETMMAGIQDFKFDAQGNIFVLLKNGNDLSILKLDPQFNYLWNRSVGGLSDDPFFGFSPSNIFARFVNDKSDNLDFISSSNGFPVMVEFNGEASSLCNSYSFAPYQITNDTDALNPNSIITNNVTVGNISVNYTPGITLTSGGSTFVDSRDYCAFILETEEMANSLETTIYPNPSSGKFSVKADENIASIEIIDLHGRLIETIMVNGQLAFDVDLNYLNAGIYYVNTILNSSKSVREKIVIQ